QHGDELRELGMATFLDRPFGGGKQATEPDETLLLSYQAFSRTIARRRLELLFSDEVLGSGSATLRPIWATFDALPLNGISVNGLPGRRDHAIASLADALRSADDFMLLRTTAKTWLDFNSEYHFMGALSERFSVGELRYPKPVLVLRETLPGATREAVGVYDSKYRKRLELDFDPREGYVRWNGVERPVSPLRVRRVWEETQVGDELREHDLGADPIMLRPR